MLGACQGLVEAGRIGPVPEQYTAVAGVVTAVGYEAASSGGVCHRLDRLRRTTQETGREAPERKTFMVRIGGEAAAVGAESHRRDAVASVRRGSHARPRGELT